MTGYELISKLDPLLVDTLIQKGLLRSTVKRDMRICEYYINQCHLCHSRMQARTNTAEQFSISEDHVSRIMHKMK